MQNASPMDYFAFPANGVAGRARVIAQIGQSLDGRIATISGESRGISGAGALDHLHRLRAQADAVIVGVGTVEADDPSLTVRRVEGGHPLRVILDPSARMSRQSRCLGAANGGCLVVTCVDALWPFGVEVLQLERTGGSIDPAQIIAALARRGLFRLLVEGGATTISRFIDAACIDRLHLMLAPIILGSGRSGLELRGEAALARALRPPVTMRDLGGGDILFECDLRTAMTQRDAHHPYALVYKLTNTELWQRAQTLGRFTGAPVDIADGFIHFSHAGQVEETAARHFAGQKDLLLVAIHTSLLGPALKWEASRGGDLFPHLYGDLPLSAVANVAALARKADGTLDFAGLLK